MIHTKTIVLKKQRLVAGSMDSIAVHGQKPSNSSTTSNDAATTRWLGQSEKLNGVVNKGYKTYRTLTGRGTMTRKSPEDWDTFFDRWFPAIVATTLLVLGVPTILLSSVVSTTSLAFYLVTIAFGYALQLEYELEEGVLSDNESE